MSDRWKRWRAYADDVEDALRWAASDLAFAERIAAEEHGFDSWPVSRKETIGSELVRRVLDTPVIGDLLGTAARHGTSPLRARHDATLRPWAETSAPGDDPRPATRVDLRAVAPPSPGARPPRRLCAAEAALARRSRSLVPVLDELTVPRNASAVMRTVEALGLQELHFVDPTGSFLAQSSVSKRADQWLDVHQAPDVRGVLDALRARGYRVLAADFGPRSLPLEDVPITGRIAVVFGSEQLGVSEMARAQADDLFHIPIEGFTTYLNVSVAAAIALYAIDRRQAAAGLRLPLDEADRHRLRVRWYHVLASGNHAREIEYARWLHRPPVPEEHRPQAHGCGAFTGPPREATA